jgi:hypothetical protein
VAKVKMGWTEEHFAQVRDAYVSAVTGNRKVSFTLGTGGGFTRSMTYQQIGAAELRNLMADIRAELDGTSALRTTTLRTHKGIG